MRLKEEERLNMHRVRTQTQLSALMDCSTGEVGDGVRVGVEGGRGRC